MHSYPTIRCRLPNAIHKVGNSSYLWLLCSLLHSLSILVCNEYDTIYILVLLFNIFYVWRVQCKSLMPIAMFSLDHLPVVIVYTCKIVFVIDKNNLKLYFLKLFRESNKPCFKSIHPYLSESFFRNIKNFKEV